jgi:hypothetical protein
MIRQRKYYCMFCGDEIFPEEGFEKDGTYYIFQCENFLCNALYESQGTQIPRLSVLHRPTYFTDEKIIEDDL